MSTAKEQGDKSRQEATRISNRELANEVWREFYERRAGMSADEEKQEFLTLVTAAFTRSHVEQNWRYIPANPPPKDTPIELLCADSSVASVDYYDGYGRFHDGRVSNVGGIFWRPVSALSTTPQKRLAAWVDGVCKTCGQYTHSCKCEHPGRDFMKRLFAAPQEGAGSPAGPATNGEPAAAASWLDTIPTAADGVTCHIRDVRRAFALSATPRSEPVSDSTTKTIYVNGTKHSLSRERLHYEEVVRMAGHDPKRVLTVTYLGQRSGSMEIGCIPVAVEAGMRFDVGNTSSA